MIYLLIGLLGIGLSIYFFVKMRKHLALAQKAEIRYKKELDIRLKTTKLNEDLIQQYRYSFSLKANPLQKNGNTTRLIALYIDKLYETGHIQVQDHHFSQKANELLFQKIRNRIQNEHPEDAEKFLFIKGKLRIRKKWDIWNTKPTTKIFTYE